LTLAEAAQEVRLSRSRLYELATSGQVPCHQLNGKGKLLFRRSDLEAALKPRAIKAKLGDVSRG
jgi:excisionase family DNA binding protein